LVHGLARRHADAIARHRHDGPFVSFDDFARRTALSSAVLRKLAAADAFRSLRLDRRSALWRSLPSREPFPLFDHVDEAETTPALPVMGPLEEVLADYGSAGLSLRQHPMAFLRPRLDELDVQPANRLSELDVDCRLKVAGVVLLRQRPSTAKGITFVTLEDETGMLNLIIRQNVWERNRRVARSASVMLAHGRLQKEASVIHVLVTKLEDLSAKLAELHTTSRDFR
jgi:error-prone DNA polymerase